MCLVGILYFIAINLAAFFCFYRDKRLAMRHQFRIRERTLLLLCLLGGSLGGLAAMLLFRHKTRHLKFTLGVPLLLALNGAVAVLFCLMFPSI